VRRLPLVFVAVLAAGLLAACGSGKKSSTTSSGPSAEAQITTAYTKFFSGKTPIAERIALLQNGEKFRSVIAGFSANPLAKSSKATVKSVTLKGANGAKVVFVVSLSGTSLPQLTGSAVKQNGQWKVGDSSLCKLIATSGTTPSVCTKS
jgi:hypothetical protein